MTITSNDSGVNEAVTTASTARINAATPRVARSLVAVPRPGEPRARCETQQRDRAGRPAVAVTDQRHTPAFVSREKCEHDEGGQDGGGRILPSECHRYHLLFRISFRQVVQRASVVPRLAACGRALISRITHQS